MKLFNLLIEALDADAAAQQLKSAFKSTSVSGFVSKFKQIASDPTVQAVLKAGRSDGKPEDEQIEYSETNLAVKGLLPTQSEIGFDQSIENIITDQYGSLASILKGNADVGGPIVTYNGKYVIDGHHRWSQVFAANPDASMAAIDLKGNLKPTEILKVVHAAIAADLGQVPSSNPKGINILNGVEEKQVKEKVDAKLTDKAKKIWADNGQKDNDAIAKHIYDNLQKLISSNKPVPGAPGRKDMPQTDAGGSKAPEKLAALVKGAVNFKDPSKGDIQKVKDAKAIKRLSAKGKQQQRQAVDEIAYADLSGMKIGSSSVDPTSGVKTTVSGIDPETGKVSWDVDYQIDPMHIKNELEKLIDYIGKVEPGSNFEKFQTVLKQLQRQASKLK